MAKQKYSAKVEQEVLEAIMQNKSLASLYESNTEVYPHPTLVSKWIERKPAFRELALEARRIGINQLVEHKLRLRENKPKRDSYDDLKEYNAAMRSWAMEIKSLEFDIVRLAPIFNRDFNIAKKQEVKSEATQINTNMNVYTIADWSQIDMSKLEKPK